MYGAMIGGAIAGIVASFMKLKAFIYVTPAFLKEQFDCVFEDIFPDAVKIGMVSQPELIESHCGKAETISA